MIKKRRRLDQQETTTSYNERLQSALSTLVNVLECDDATARMVTVPQEILKFLTLERFIHVRTAQAKTP